MRSVLLLVIHQLILIARLLGPGGSKSVIAVNLLLKHQLTVLGRVNRKAPNIKSSDRCLLEMRTLFMNARRRVASAVVEIKRRNPRFGSTRIVCTIALTFGVEVTRAG